MKVFGIVGWKNSGKTGLVERLVTEITSRGFSVSTVKHAHHEFDVDQPGRDSFRHREAGAQQVMLASAHRWALMSELRGEPEPELADLVSRMDKVDLVLIEGFKRTGHQKLECSRVETGKDLIAPTDPSICAVACDYVAETTLPCLELDDTVAIADFVLEQAGLS